MICGTDGTTQDVRGSSAYWMREVSTTPFRLRAIVSESTNEFAVVMLLVQNAGAPADDGRALRCCWYTARAAASGAGERTAKRKDAPATGSGRKNHQDLRDVLSSCNPRHDTRTGAGDFTGGCTRTRSLDGVFARADHPKRAAPAVDSPEQDRALRTPRLPAGAEPLLSGRRGGELRWSGCLGAAFEVLARLR